MIRHVRPRRTSRIWRRISASFRTSTLAKASSRIKILGSVRTPRARAARRRWPPEGGPVGPEGDVLPDGAGEEKRLLRDVPDGRAQVAERNFMNLPPVDEELAGRRIKEARNQG